MNIWTPPTAMTVGVALRSLPNPVSTPLVLGYWPVANMNPFQALLYSAFAEQGVAVTPMRSWQDVQELSVAPNLGARAAFHLHWTSPIAQSAPDEASAALQTREFVSSLDASGVDVIWTVHNIQPHSTRYPDVERQLRTAVAERAKVIHLMSGGSRSMLEKLYPIDESAICIVPHPSLAPGFPRIGLGRARARQWLEVAPESVAIGSVGSISPYKGISELVQSVEELRLSGVPAHGIIAGIPGNEPGSKDLVRRISSKAHVSVVARKLNPTEMVAAHEASDMIALPYRASLNSGAAHLALGLKRPVVAPDHVGFEDVVTEDTGVLYDERMGLTDAIRLAIDRIHSVGFDSSAFSQALRTRDPETVSTSLASEIRRRTVEAG